MHHLNLRSSLLWYGSLLVAIATAGCERDISNAAIDASHMDGDASLSMIDGGGSVSTDANTPPATATEKFLPSFVVKYCSPGSGLRSAQETANFDLLVVSSSHSQSWSEGGLNSWQSIKAYNPDFVALLYAIGPGEYDMASYSEMGLGWQWMKDNHGATAGADRWTGSGLAYPYLGNDLYSNERMMNLGHPDWQNYWWQTLYDDHWGGARGADQTGADGIFSDVTLYKVSYSGHWYDENHKGDSAYRDHPADYYSGGAYDHAAWRQDTNAFFARAVPGLAASGLALCPNFSTISSIPTSYGDASDWLELDAIATPPRCALVESGFVQPYGGTYGAFEWRSKVNTIRSMQNLAALITNHGTVTTGDGLARMDVTMSDGVMGPTTGWDALWFSLSSMLMALNPERTNAYMNFTVWGYCDYHWLDELDPAHLHFGDAVGEYVEVDGVFLREYDDGWAVVNPSAGAKTVTVPSGQARIIDHANFKDPSATAPVSSFSLGGYRGVLLLKDGRQAGNTDNATP